LNKTLVQLQDFVRTRVPAEINVRHIVAEGSVYDVIIKTAVQINADAIVMDASRPEQLNYLLGPNVARVVRHATCSVLLVRE
jgi:nucleotide-binding universal stress UspA family protein